MDAYRTTRLNKVRKSDRATYAPPADDGRLLPETPVPGSVEQVLRRNGIPDPT